jgi:hypothetical protein
MILCLTCLHRHTQKGNTIRHLISRTCMSSSQRRPYDDNLIARITRLLIAEIRHLTHQQPYRHVTSFAKKKLNLVPRCVTFIVMRARTRLFTGPVFHIELRVGPTYLRLTGMKPFGLPRRRPFSAATSNAGI